MGLRLYDLKAYWWLLFKGGVEVVNEFSVDGSRNIVICICVMKFSLQLIEPAYNKFERHFYHCPIILVDKFLKLPFEYKGLGIEPVNITVAVLTVIIISE